MKLDPALADDSVAICTWLFTLTLADLIIAYMPIERVLMIVGLTGLAIGKVSLVAMHRMDLRFGRRTLGVIAVGPPLLLLLCVFAADPAAWTLVRP